MRHGSNPPPPAGSKPQPPPTPPHSLQNEVRKVLWEMSIIIERHGVPNYLVNEIEEWYRRLKNTLEE